MDKSRNDLTYDKIELLNKNLNLINRMANEIDNDISSNSDDLPDLVLEKSKLISKAADELIKEFQK